MRKLKKKLRKKLSSYNVTTLSFEEIKQIYQNKEKGYEIIEALLDDLNTPKVIAQINKITNQEQIPEKTLQLLKYIDEKILKLDLQMNFFHLHYLLRALLFLVFVFYS